LLEVDEGRNAAAHDHECGEGKQRRLWKQKEENDNDHHRDYQQNHMAGLVSLLLCRPEGRADMKPLSSPGSWPLGLVANAMFCYLNM
jgi:hypothetical protein